MLPSEILIWQPEFTDKTLSRKPGAVHECFAEVFLPYVSAGFSFRSGMVCSVSITLNQRVVALLNAGCRKVLPR
nr:hypothetical protein [Escherichia coli]